MLYLPNPIKKIVNNKRRIGLFFAVPLLLISALTAVAIYYRSAQAAIVIWDGDAGDNLWSSPTNWSGDTLPGTSDIATFNSTSDTNVTIDMDINVRGIDIESSYTSIITQASGTDIYIHGEGFTQESGTFTGGDSSFYISDSHFTLNGGTFTSTSDVLSLQRNFTINGGTFNHNSGTVAFVGDGGDDSTMICGTAALNSVQLRKTQYSGYLTIQPSCTVDFGNTPLTGGWIENYGTLTVGTGHWDATYYEDTFLTTHNGATTTINSSSVSGLEIMRAQGGTISANGLTSYATSNSRNYNAIEVSSSGSLSLTSLVSMDISDGSISLADPTGIFTAPALTTVTLERSLNNSGNKLPNGLDVLFDGDGGDDATLTCGTETYNSVAIRKSAWHGTFTIQPSCNIDLGSTPYSGGWIYNYGTLTIGTGHWDATYGDDTFITTYTGGTTTINSTSVSGLQAMRAQGGSISANNLVNYAVTNSLGQNAIEVSSSGSLSLTSLVSMDINDGGISLADSSGTFAATALTTVTLERSLDNSGNKLPNGLDVLFDGDGGDDAILTCGTETYNSVAIRKTQYHGMFNIQPSCNIDLGNTPYSGGWIYNYGTLTIGTGHWDATYGDGTFITTYTGGTTTINSTSVSGLQAMQAQGGSISANNLVNYAATNSIGRNAIEVSSSGIISLSSAISIDINSGHIQLADPTGTFNVPSLTLVNLERSLDNSGNLMPNNLDIYFDGNDNNQDSDINCGSIIFDTVTIDKQTDWAHLRYYSDCVVAGDYTLTRAQMIDSSNPQTIYIGGNLTINSNNNYSSPNVTYELNGTGIQTITKYKTNSIDNAVNVDKSSGTAVLMTDFDTTGSCLLSDGTLDINTFDLICTGALGVSTGTTFRLAGDENPTVPTIGSNSTIEYSGDDDGLVDTYTLKSWPYENLTINADDGDSEVFNFPATLTLPYDFACLSGTCTAPSTTFTVAGDWNVTGNYDHNSGDVVFNGGDQTIAGSTTFDDFSKVVASQSTLTFPGSGLESQVFEGTMEMRGASGQLLRLRSSIGGTQWHIEPQGIRTIEYLDVQDSYNDDASVILVTGFNITNSGNNYNWEFNAEPQTSNLGPTAYVQGDYISDTTPTLTFTVTDPNGGDTVQYHIQIDNAADFLTPAVDYTSALGAQGAKSFTVGQAEGSGSYTVGNEGQTLSDDSYYFRIRGIDDEASAGAFALANGGSVAFQLDFSEPGLVQSLDSSTHTVATWGGDDQITTTWTAPVETGSGIAGYSYVFDETSNTDPDTSADLGVVTQVTSNSLGSGSSYYFHIRAVDAQGNWGDTAHLGPFYIDVTNPASPTNLGFSGGYELPWVGATTVTVTWTAGTDSHSGVTGYSYDFDMLPGTTPDTVADLGVVTQEDITGIVVGNDYYFHIRSRDSVGNWGDAVHFGPFALDEGDPTVPGTPDAVTPEDEVQPVVSWLDATDADSGIDHYEIQVSKDNTFTEGVFSVEVDTNTYEFSNDLATGTWYARVRSYDAVGNESAFSDMGSFEISSITVVVPDEDDGETVVETVPGETETVYLYITQESEDILETPETGEEEIEEEIEDTVFIVTVRDSSGNSLANMSVTLVNSQGEETIVQTDENGVAAFQGVTAGVYRVEYQKNGTKYSKDISVKEVEGEDEYASLEVKFEESDVVEKESDTESDFWKYAKIVLAVLVAVGIVIVFATINVLGKRA